MFPSNFMSFRQKKETSPSKQILNKKLKGGGQYCHFLGIGALASFLVINKFPLAYKLKIRLSRPNLKKKI